MDFEELYQQYYRQVYGYAMTLCRNPHDARDITDETFFKAFGGYHRFRGDCSPGVWLCQIAKNLFPAGNAVSTSSAGASASASSSGD